LKNFPEPEGMGGVSRAGMLLCCTLSLFFLLLLNPSSGWAASFPDLEGHWGRYGAERVAALGIMRGTGTGKFDPDRNITRYETLAVLVRISGGEEEARELKLEGEVRSRLGTVPSWAEGYLAYALGKGIVLPDEVSSFREPEAVLTRQELASWLARTLGLVSGGERPPFQDWDQASPRHREGIAATWAYGLLRGAYGLFRPSQPLTRAEMAQVAHRLSRLLGERGISGTYLGLGSRGEIRLRTAQGEERSFPLHPEASLFLDGIWASGTYVFVPGDRVTVLTDDSGRAVLVDGRPRGSVMEGVLEEIRLSPRPLLRVRKGEGEVETVLASTEALVSLDSRPARLKDLRTGQPAILELSSREKGEVVWIFARSVLTDVQGTVYAIRSLEGDLLLTVKTEKEERVFRLSRSFPITRNGRPAPASALEVRDLVRLRVRDGEVVRLSAESYERTVTGTLREIFFGAPVRLEVELGEGDLKESYPLSSAAEVRRAGLRVGPTALRAGDRLSLRLRGGEVVALEAEPARTTVEGTVYRVVIGQPHEVSLLLADGSLKTYPVAEGAEVWVGGERSSLLNLRPGLRVAVTLTQDGIQKVEAGSSQLLEEVRGVVRYLDERERAVVLELEGGRGTRRLKLGSGFWLLKGERLYQGEMRLELGDLAVAFGRDDPGGYFQVRLLVVLTGGR